MREIGDIARLYPSRHGHKGKPFLALTRHPSNQYLATKGRQSYAHDSEV